MRKLLLVGVLMGFGTGGFAAEPAADWKMPKADAEKWVARVKKLARDGWTVSLDGNEITVRRNKPTAFAYQPPNAMIGAKPLDGGQRTVRYVLRFAPKLTTDEYEKLAAVNETSDKEYDRLHRAVGLAHKFDDFIATTPEEKARVAAFREAVAKLPRHTLPDLYTPEYSVFFYQTGDGGVSPGWVADKDVRAECDDVLHTLLKYFGMYNLRAAAGGQGFGQYLPEPRR
jgi:hypothetical protein